ncbi:hypothetical protein E1287_32040 [Actinomadura sp. KC06]|nr:hypothetical protein E1287_32040 [Actinomadura sp. KC06]
MPDPAEYTAYDARTGAERWRVRLGSRVNFPPVSGRAGNPPGTFFKGTFYYGDGAKVVGVDPATGRIRHQTVGEGVDAGEGAVEVTGAVFRAVAVEGAGG